MKLSKQELFIMKSFLMCSRDIQIINSELCNLELQNKTNTDEYKKLVNKLKNKFYKERSIYKGLSYNTAKRIYEYIISDIKKSVMNIDVALDYDNYKNYILRVALNLLDVMMTYLYNVVYDMIKNDKENLLTHPQTLKTYIELQNQIEKDIYLAYLIILEEYIEKSKNTSIRKKLIKYKYNFCLLHKDLQKFLFDNDFKVPKDFYSSSKLYSDLKKISSNYYFSVKKLYCKDTCLEELSKISKIDFIKQDQNIYYILKEAYIRSLFMYMTDEEINDVFLKFYNHLKNSNLKANKFSQSILSESFNYKKTDKEKIKILSFIKF